MNTKRIAVLTFLIVLVLCCFAVIEYQCLVIRDECKETQFELQKASKEIDDLNNQAADVNGKKAINKAIETKSLELYTKGFNSGYECGYGFGYIDCHDGKPYNADIPGGENENNNQNQETP